MSLNSKFTPGPWRYDGRAYIWGPKSEMVAMIRGTGEGLPEDDNGRLIAAAPKLLEACKKVLSLFDTLEAGTDESDPLRKLRAEFHGPYRAALKAAIQEAEGERQP